MNSKATREIVYEDFEPTCNWVREEQSDTLVLLLPGFRREEMKVQITSNQILKVSGEEKTEDKRSVRRRRFYKEFSVPGDANVNQISAKFEDGKLIIKLPKVMSKKKPSPTHHKEEAVSPKAKQASKKKKKKKKKEEEDDDEAVNNKKQVWKLMIGFIVALIMLVLVIWIGFRNNAMQHYSSPHGTSGDIQELFLDAA